MNNKNKGKIIGNSLNKGDMFWKYSNDIPKNRTKCYIQEVIDNDNIRVNDAPNFMGFSILTTTDRLCWTRNQIV